MNLRREVDARTDTRTGRAARGRALLVALVVVGAWLFRPDETDPSSNENDASSETSDSSSAPGKSGLGSGVRAPATVSDHPSDTAPGPTIVDGPGGTTGDADSKKPAPEPTGAPLYLRMIDASTSAPIANTEFSVILHSPIRSFTQALRTDANGVCSITRLRPKTYATLTRTLEYLPDHRDLTIVEEGKGAADARGTEEQPIEIRFEPGARFTGRVLDTKRKPVSRARLTLVRKTGDGPQRRAAASDRAGNFRFAGLDDGAWTLTVAHQQYRSAGPIEVLVPEQESAEIILPDDRPAIVRVLDPDGTPLANVRVKVRVAGVLASSRIVSPAVSDTRGNASIKNLPSTDDVMIGLTATHANYPNVALEVSVADLDAGGVEIRFRPGLEVRGHVVDSEDLVVPGAQVELAGGKTVLLRSTGDGEFHFKKFPPGEYQLRAVSTEYGSAPAKMIQLGTESITGLIIKLEAGPATISGRVLNDEGVPMTLVIVRLDGEGRGMRVATNRDGVFRFSSLPHGQYRISAGDLERGHAVVEGVKSDAQDVEIRLKSPGSIAGRIRSSGPARAYSIRLITTSEPPAPPRIFRFSSRVSQFHLEHLPPATYRLELMQRSEIVGTVEGIEVAPGNTIEDVEVRDERVEPEDSEEE